jgi:hypothetical protein
MSCVVIGDIEDSRLLDWTEAQRIAGGMDVKIDRITTTVETADDGLILPSVFGVIVNSVIEGIARSQRRPPM